MTCSATGFGATGPWAQAPAYDVTLQALSGAMSITGNGNKDDPPIRWGHPVGGLAGGLYGAIAVFASLRDVRRGRPPGTPTCPCSTSRSRSTRIGSRRRSTSAIDFKPEPARGRQRRASVRDLRHGDGRWFAAGITDQFWQNVLRGHGLDPGSPTIPPSRPARHARRTPAQLEEIAEALFRSRTAEELEAIFLEHRLPGSRVLTLQEAFHHPQAPLHGMLREIADLRAAPGARVRVPDPLLTIAGRPLDTAPRLVERPPRGKERHDVGQITVGPGARRPALQCREMGAGRRARHSQLHHAGAHPPRGRPDPFRPRRRRPAMCSACRLPRASPAPGTTGCSTARIGRAPAMP